jgi:hypothetical protein
MDQCTVDWVMGLGISLPKPAIPVVVVKVVPIRSVSCRSSQRPFVRRLDGENARL